MINDFSFNRFSTFILLSDTKFKKYYDPNWLSLKTGMSHKEQDFAACAKLAINCQKMNLLGGINCVCFESQTFFL